jgi:hypothetical protein
VFENLATTLAIASTPDNGSRRVELAQHRLQHLQLIRVGRIRVTQRNNIGALHALRQHLACLLLVAHVRPSI